MMKNIARRLVVFAKKAYLCKMNMLPEDFIQQTKAVMGDELWKVVEQALTLQQPPTSIRLNRTKGMGRDQLAVAPLKDVPWCDDGWQLDTRPAFTFDPCLHAGAYYVQESSSMFLHHIIRQHVRQPVLMLDLCAAPGGKSTLARTALPEGSLLVSNEPIRNRAQILAENMQKWGHEDVIVTNSYPRDFGKSGLLFDVILTDVPCSGEGMFRKDSGAIDEWSLQNVEQCWKLQREIVADAWKCLKAGGLLIYGTCTFNTKENEENVRWIAEELGGSIVGVDVDESWNITGSLLEGFDKPVYRFLPGKTCGEGLFMAIVRKEGRLDEEPAKPKKVKKAKGGQPDRKKTVALPLTDAHRFVAAELNGHAVAIPSAWKEVYDKAVAKLHVLHAGVPIGENKGKDLVPDTGLALSRCLLRGAFPQCELTYEQAVAYLRREAVALPDSTPRGFVLVTYRTLPLGFVKNIGTRANNLYPAEWKIRSSHAPETPPEIVITDKE
jgi:16S rRNA C967 or C1407 C5-methylase (RsmB/RsmF family)/NOL1/NOP2/fmu family ribosome biogenesis protein